MANKSMKAFMKEDVKERGTQEFPGIERYKDENGQPIPFIIKCLNQKELEEIRAQYKEEHPFKDKDGKYVFLNDGTVATRRTNDTAKAGLDILVSAFVQPKLDDEELMAYYGVLNRLDMPYTIFPTSEEFRYANKCVMEACGISAKKKDDSEVVEDLKN